MTRHAILTGLKTERDRLDTAIAAIEGGRTTPRKRASAGSADRDRPRRRRRMSAEARKRISEAMKRWWGKRKRARS